MQAKILTCCVVRTYISVLTSITTLNSPCFNSLIYVAIRKLSFKSRLNPVPWTSKFTGLKMSVFYAWGKKKKIIFIALRRNMTTSERTAKREDCVFIKTTYMFLPANMF